MHKLIAVSVLLTASPASAQWALYCVNYAQIGVTYVCTAYSDGSGPPWRFDFGQRFVRMPAIACGPGEYLATSGDCVPDPDNNPVGASAICGDNLFSHSEHAEGTCSHHQGVARWLAPATAAPPTQ